MRDRARPVPLEIVRLVEAFSRLIAPDEIREISSAYPQNRICLPHIACGGPEEVPPLDRSLFREHGVQPFDVRLTRPAPRRRDVHEQQSGERYPDEGAQLVSGRQPAVERDGYQRDEAAPREAQDDG